MSLRKVKLGVLRLHRGLPDTARGPGAERYREALNTPGDRHQRLQHLPPRHRPKHRQKFRVFSAELLRKLGNLGRPLARLEK